MEIPFPALCSVTIPGMTSTPNPVDSPSSRLPENRSVVEQLLDLILETNLKPGDRLPAERALSETLDVGRAAVREAISTLDFLGFVKTVGGSGTYLREASSELLPSTLRWGMTLNQGNSAELHKVRAILEVAAVEAAAPHYDKVRLQELGDTLRRQYEAAHNPQSFVEADTAFHRHIAATAGNSILEDLLSTARSLLRIWVERSVHKEKDLQDALREHSMVLEALKNGETANAVAAMRLHMMTAHVRLMTAIETEPVSPQQGHPDHKSQ